jgi:hypothetical protein
MEVSMRHVLQLAFLLAAFAGSPAIAQQVAPTQLAPTPLLQGLNSTACLVSCDTQVMNCQNACVTIGPTTTANSAGNAPCALSCSTPLVCKQACNRTPQ